MCVCECVSNKGIYSDSLHQKWNPFIVLLFADFDEAINNKIVHFKSLIKNVLAIHIALIRTPKWAAAQWSIEVRSNARCLQMINWLGYYLLCVIFLFPLFCHMISFKIRHDRARSRSRSHMRTADLSTRTEWLVSRFSYSSFFFVQNIILCITAQRTVNTQTEKCKNVMWFLLFASFLIVCIWRAFESFDEKEKEKRKRIKS